MTAWVLVVIFTISNTGFTVFKHFCSTSHNTYLSIMTPESCETEDDSKDCCLTVNQQKKAKDDCCDDHATFAKFLPDGKPEAETSLLSSLFSFNLSLPVLTLSGWQPTIQTEGIRLTAHPPDPQIHQPPSNSDHILSLGIMLC